MPTERPAPTRAQDAIVLGLLLLVFGVVYAATCCRDLYWSDSAEYATAAYTGGVPHPPGYPLYTMIARVFLALLPLTPAAALNAMSALFALLALALAYALGRALGAEPAAAAGGAALLGSGPAFWHNATVAEVYAPGLCFSLATLLLLLRAHGRAEPRYALFAAGVAGAGLGVHYSLATLGLGFAWLAGAAADAHVRTRVAPEARGARARAVVSCLLKGGLISLAAYLAVCSYFVWIASPEGVPNHARPLSAARLIWLVSGGNYRLWFLEDYDRLARAVQVATLIAREVTVPGIVCAVLGVVWLGSRNATAAIALGLAFAGNVFFFFRYRVGDLEVFFLPAVAIACMCAALAVEGAIDRFAARVGAPPLLRTSLPLVLCSISVHRLVTGYAERDLHHFTDASDYGERLSNELPAQAVILNYTTPDEWRYDAVFGQYFQHVLGRRRDVVVVKNAERLVIDRLLAESRPVYLYSRVAHVAREYTLEPEGDLYRVRGTR